MELYYNNITPSILLVRLIGLEPTRRKAPDPKSGVSTNFTTGAGLYYKGSAFFLFCKLL